MILPIHGPNEKGGRRTRNVKHATAPPLGSTGVIVVDILLELAADILFGDAELLRRVLMRTFTGLFMLLKPDFHVLLHGGLQRQAIMPVDALDNADRIGVEIPKVDIVKALSMLLAGPHRALGCDAPQHDF